MNIDDVVSKFNTTPFLFVGSGFTRRYLNLPDWKSLLAHFAFSVSEDDFAYSSYENLAGRMDCPAGIMPKIAELIQADYNNKWFTHPEMRTLDADGLESVKNGGDPFKHEIAAHLMRIGSIQEVYLDEIELLKRIANKSVSGIITTNYDSFLEDTFAGYKKYVGQKQLIFSAIQGIAEIYKIHGSVETADSIVINERDYQIFMEDSSYLAAKLMTIFMEYPIVFIGYSINDSNILEIIKSIVHCLNDEQMKLLEERFVFVEYRKGFVGAEVSPHTIVVDGRALMMRKITLDDFTLLYKALENKRAKLPVRLLRRFKEELYDYTITSVPTAKMRVAALEDNRVDDDELVLAIGRASELGLKGLSGIDGNDWYRDIVLGDIEFSADELLEYAFPKVVRQNSGRLPVNKYLSQAQKNHEDAELVAQRFPFDKIISATIKKHRASLGDYKSVAQIWEQEKGNIERATRLMAYLEEDQIDVDELETVLRYLFESDVNILNNEKEAARTNIRRMIRIYDYLKWGKKMECSDNSTCKQIPRQDTPGSD